MDQLPKNILLVYPRIPDNTYWSFALALPFIGKRAALPPLGLITVAAMLPDWWEARLVDENVTQLTDAALEWADMVFVSAMIIQSQAMANVIRRAREAGVTVVAGGPHPTQSYDLIEGVDHFVLGEAESGTLAAFLDDVVNGTPKRVYARHALRRNPAEKRTDEAEFRRLAETFPTDSDLAIVAHRPEMAASPLPRFDLLDFDAYGSLAVQLSRGCPHTCEFCNEYVLFGHRPRVKSASQMLAELQRIYDLGFRGEIFFVDDNFIGNIRKVSDVLHAIIRFQKERNYPFGFYTEATIKLAEDPKLMELMRAAGFNMVFVGIETVDQTTLEATGKTQNTHRNLLEDVHTIQAHGMEVTAGFIVGLDGEPDDTCDQVFTFCQEAGIPTVMTGLLTPLAGSPLYERLRREGRLLETKPGGNNTHCFKLDYIPDRGRDPQVIVDTYRALLAQLYDRDGNNYFQRCRVFLRNQGPGPRAVRRVGTQELKSLIRSLCRQTFAPYGRAYVRFLKDILFSRYRKLPEAVRCAITGHHLICITNYALEADAWRCALQSWTEPLHRGLASLQKGLAHSRERVQDGVVAFREAVTQGQENWQRRISEMQATLAHSREQWQVSAEEAQATVASFLEHIAESMNEANERLRGSFAEGRAKLCEAIRMKTRFVQEIQAQIATFPPDYQDDVKAAFGDFAKYLDEMIQAAFPDVPLRSLA